MVDSLKAWLVGHPPTDDQFTASLESVASRVVSGEDLLHAVREFLDELALMNPEQMRRAIQRRPSPTGDARFDAYLAALAEHVAAIHGLERPDWSHEPGRFLDHFWFVSEVKGFRALALVESPAAFRRRGIFISAGSLSRV
jgi:hypothetical protein